MGGMGKTCLAVKFGKCQESQFKYIIYRSFKYSIKPVKEILSEWLKVLSNNQITDLSNSIEEQINKLLNYLSNHRCLLILDNIESILDSSQAGKYQEYYQEYGQLFERIGNYEHNSCLLLTSKEKPDNLSTMAGKGEGCLVRFFGEELKGLNAQEVKKFYLQIYPCFNQSEIINEDWEKLTKLYRGNPLFLKLTATRIRENYNGKISIFFENYVINKNGNIAFQQIQQEVLSWYYERLSARPSEQTVIYWLAISAEALSEKDLEENIIFEQQQDKVEDIIFSLNKNFLLEKEENGEKFTLQSVLKDYIHQKFIENICEEITTKENSLKLLRKYALLKASDKDYVRKTQIKLILEKINTRLIKHLSEKNYIKTINENLERLRQISQEEQIEYAAANLIHLIINCRNHIENVLKEVNDFSDLTVKQAYLQEIELHDFNFTNTVFSNCIFTQDFKEVLSVAFSPTRNLLATGDVYGEIKLWLLDEEKNELKLQFSSKKHTELIHSLAFSPDGKILASGSDDQTLKLWKIEEIEEEDHRTIEAQCFKNLKHEGAVRAVAFSPNGQFLASGIYKNGQNIRIWKTSNYDKCHWTLPGHEQRWVHTLAFSPDSQTLASGSYDHTVKLWNVKTGQCKKPLKEAHGSTVLSVAFSPDGRTIASSGHDNKVKMWNTKTGECLKTWGKFPSVVWSLAFKPSNDGEILLVGGSDNGSVRLWKQIDSINYQEFSWENEQKRDGGIGSVAFTRNGQNLITTGNNNKLKLWDVNTGQCLRTLQGYIMRINSVAFHPNGKTLAVGCDDCTVNLWNIDKKEYEPLKGHTRKIYSVAFSPDGRILASGSGDKTVKLWDISDIQEVHDSLKKHTKWVLSVAFSPDGKILASGSDDNTVKLWDLSDIQNINLIPSEIKHSQLVLSVAFSPDGKILASGSGDKTVKLWDLNDIKNINLIPSEIKHSQLVLSVAFSSDGTILASGSGDKTVKLWDISNVKDVKFLCSLNKHTKAVKSVTFSPDEKILASASEDQTINLWNVENFEISQFCTPIPLEGHTDKVYAVAFSQPISQQKLVLASGSADGIIKVWKLEKTQNGAVKLIENDENPQTLEIPKPYHGMNISGIKGLNKAEKQQLINLGAKG